MYLLDGNGNGADKRIQQLGGLFFGGALLGGDGIHEILFVHYLSCRGSNEVATPPDPPSSVQSATADVGMFFPLPALGS
ncbi:hypothetical protein [Paraburkholderia graminis]|uniref:Uncharacterized protein n=1 Tax=Paraburkholderia graminis TaxID=60548 RepID=A0ABD5CUK0_9BURK|nr:hypothetical protein [Paraburkholderia graminis]MDR6208132.1 hypothetical protein [Paraburkholderia graminis]